jgi:uncharacterized membrane protein
MRRESLEKLKKALEGLTEAQINEALSENVREFLEENPDIKSSKVHATREKEVNENGSR